VKQKTEKTAKHRLIFSSSSERTGMSHIERLTDRTCAIPRLPVFALRLGIQDAPISTSTTYLTRESDGLIGSRGITAEIDAHLVDYYKKLETDALIDTINSRLVNIIDGIERDYYTRTVIDNRFNDLEQSMPIVVDAWSILNKKFSTIARTSSALFTANYPSLTLSLDSVALGGYAALEGVQRLERSSLINAHDLKNQHYTDCAYINATDAISTTPPSTRTNEVAIGGVGNGDNTVTLGTNASHYYLPGLPNADDYRPVGMVCYDKNGKLVTLSLPTGGGGGGGGGGIGSIIGAIGGAAAGGLAGIIVSKPTTGGSGVNPPSDTPSLEFTSDSSVPWERHALPADQVQVSVPELADRVSLGRNATRYSVHDGYNLMEDVLEESVSRTNYRSALLDGLDDVSDAVPTARLATISTRGTVPHLVTQNKGIINQMSPQQTSNFIKQHLVSDYEGTKKVLASQGISINQHPDSLTPRLHIDSGDASHLLVAEGKNHTISVSTRTESTTTTDPVTQQPVTTVTAYEELRLPSVPLASQTGALVTVDEAGVLHTTAAYETRTQTDAKLALKFDRTSFPAYAGGLTTLSGTIDSSFLVTSSNVTYRMAMNSLLVYLNTNIRPTISYTKTEVDAKIAAIPSPDLSAYDKGVQVDAKISSALTPYTTTSAVDTKINTVMTQVDAKIAAIPSTDLSGYDTRAQVNTKLAVKLEPTTIGPYVAGLTNAAVGTSNFFMFQNAGGQSFRTTFATLLSFIATNMSNNSFYTKSFIDNTFYKIAELDGILLGYLTPDRLGAFVRGLPTSTPVSTMSLYGATTAGHMRITMSGLVSFLTGALSLSDYSSKAELEAKLTSYPNKAEVDTKFANHYTKVDIDQRVSQLINHDWFDERVKIVNVNPTAYAWHDNVIVCPGGDMKELKDPGALGVRWVTRSAGRIRDNTNLGSYTNTLVGQNLLNNVSNYSKNNNDHIAFNTYLGQTIFPESSSGEHNRNVAVGVAIGTLAVGANVGGNILMGVDVLQNHRGDIKNSIVIGHRSGALTPQVGFDKAFENCIFLGHDTSSDYITNNSIRNEIYIGNSTHSRFRCEAIRKQVKSANQVMIDADGFGCIAPSSRRYKNNIEPITEDTVDRFEAMVPVSYNYIESGQFQLGFIAEDAMPEVLLYDAEGRPDGIQHILLHALQKASVDRLIKRVEMLETAHAEEKTARAGVETALAEVKSELAEEKTVRAALEVRLARLEALMLLGH
jgi:hypothetical protein